MKSFVVSARIPAPLADELNRQCTALKVRKSHVVVSALADWLGVPDDPRSDEERARDEDAEDLAATQADIRACLRSC